MRCLLDWIKADNQVIIKSSVNSHISGYVDSNSRRDKQQANKVLSIKYKYK